jgi:hypothetical protein
MGREELERAAARLKTALRLYEAGVAMKRAQLRRANPTINDAELRTRLIAWLRTRAGAEHGDAAGLPRALSELSTDAPA